MPRTILEENRIHPAVRDTVAGSHRGIVAEVRSAVAAHPVVVIGMMGNPMVRKARQSLRRGGIEHHYVEYGSYFSQWRRRNALKMWTGWPTFPMVFVKGMLVGGAVDVAKLVDSGELKMMLV